MHEIAESRSSTLPHLVLSTIEECREGVSVEEKVIRLLGSDTPTNKYIILLLTSDTPTNK